MMKSIKKEKSLTHNQTTELIQSYVPGSTLKSIKIKIPRIGFACYDTPGLVTDKLPFLLTNNLHTVKFLNFGTDISSNNL